MIKIYKNLLVATAAAVQFYGHYTGQPALADSPS